MTAPKENRAAPGWLAARRAADIAAREHALPFVRLLGRHLAPGPAHGFDLGTGTGANHTYLSARLGVPLRWTVLDHDQDLLADPAHGEATRITAEIADLPDLIRPGTAPTFVTCSALLDVLRRRDVEQLADVVLDLGLPALFALSVTGEVTITPADPLDGRITDTFNAHQRRDDRLGPDAPQHLAALIPPHRVRQLRTPWQLSAPSAAALLRPYLSERAAVATAQDPALAGPAAGWLARRLGQIDHGRLTVVVGHVDQLIMPEA
ncbi:MAG: hypothetical protein Q4F67_01330 [Propionibacteriaceae bacterium]|nr:hypothetical protein [Propionibacteriaceae bacterium]